ncbi:hypothetical protein [Nostoc sp. FACHB-145]|nr:hypothetical protein [Nostoc sp. FACHB-145]
MFALVSEDKTQLPPGAVVRLIASWQYERNSSAAIRDLKGRLENPIDP